VAGAANSAAEADPAALAMLRELCCNGASPDFLTHVLVRRCHGDLEVSISAGFATSIAHIGPRVERHQVASAHCKADTPAMHLSVRSECIVNAWFCCLQAAAQKLVDWDGELPQQEAAWRKSQAEASAASVREAAAAAAERRRLFARFDLQVTAMAGAMKCQPA
jgi:predicted trehalose synthase